MSVRIPVSEVTLDADVVVPEERRGVVLFAHGSGSGRHSPRNRQVAAALQSAGLATVLADLLTEAEERRDAVTAELRFDIGLLADRVTALTDWTLTDQALTTIGLFGASTGAAAALIAAARRPDQVRAVVSRGGRPDLAGDFLPGVRQPTLLIVGGDDPVVIDLNRQAMERMTAEVRLEIVPGASHLFAEPGTLEQVSRLATAWFAEHL
ncbi:Dienelactone hydrolase family protein [Nonomuraea solani]|uniref:Dienelactone hydrolase family protein n=1 Tax=Nonomuraea solani TaxID=1144553 RepID=A0A1H5VXK8_9ACTN|nr:alpha/beta family hydrolase [Nonomuraea solani]SEF91950.1 Dienelactone hydrolase family protein [Nonomuraea solani]